ncbi:ribonuclease D [Candidatus Methylacidiphilum infernorum]|uniref:ribonuclease D n=1 Tax=Candidatus Methylacidiphilum infernorum TaxID=511746 RepID=UPI0002FEBF06|nr:ribonuclease D [Candidatus Methylacidiphilum infernorum]
MEQKKEIQRASIFSTDRPIKWIDNKNALQDFLLLIDPFKPIAIDIEGDSLHHYPEKLCVVSLCQGQHLAVVDCLKDDLSALWDILSRSEWICHGMDYDLKMLRKAGCPQPRTIFDTHIAAKLCGFEAVGYARLVSLFFQVKLTKEHQKADWSRRPLPPSLINYTAKDVLYLEKLKEILTRLLKSLGRWEWMEQSCKRIQRKIENSFLGSPKEWERIEGVHKLDFLGQSILFELQKWRKELALLRDTPPFKIIKSEDLVQISFISAHGGSIAAIPAVQRLEREVVGDLLKAIEKGKQNGSWKESPGPKKLFLFDKEAAKRFEVLKNKRDKIASFLGIDPALIASRNLLSEMALHPGSGCQKLIDEDKICPWQAQLLGLSTTPD